MQQKFLIFFSKFFLQQKDAISGGHLRLLPQLF